MIAALLPTVAGDLRVSVAQAGLLVSIFALAYATSSPVLTTLTGRVDRRKLLLASMGIFAFLNVAAAMAHTWSSLAAARMLLAFAAGIYTPNANALAGALVSADHRGRAIAVVNGGLTAAIALGVPLGAFVGDRLGWRMTFIGVGLLSALATAGLTRGLPRGDAAPRFAGRSGALYVGLSAGVGLFVSGNATDRFGSRVVLRASLIGLILALAGLAIVANLITPAHALVPVLAVMALWGISGWAFFPAQQTRLIEIVGLASAPVGLSLNASFMYLGFSLGAGLGGFSLLHAGPQDLGFVGATCEIAALTLLLVTQSREARPQ